LFQAWFDAIAALTDCSTNNIDIKRHQRTLTDVNGQGTVLPSLSVGRHRRPTHREPLKSEREREGLLPDGCKDMGQLHPEQRDKVAVRTSDGHQNVTRADLQKI
jgi:hypothetical protein